MNLDELRPILTGYRQQVEAAWSPATAHPDFEGKAGDPAGQCGVTSAWLQRRLAEDHGISSTCWTGFLVTVRDGKSARHCWLELDTTEVDVIVDLTADQAPSLKDRPVICDAFDALFVNGIDYHPHRGYDRHELADSVQLRLAVLEAAMS